ncbi:DoxX family protein [uncultured Nocardioides sp.]|jgi:putative oxidoreductase|nr:DoxX family protein [uncultured Nocardioides sp.]HEX5987036.1 DoxX family protein [Nocardioides sp.]
MTLGLLIIRVVLGLLLVGHGAQKLLGWFGGAGLRGTAGFFDSVGYRPGRRMAVLAGLAEVTGGALVALGLLTPLGAAIVIGTMFAAAAVHSSHGLWNANGGYELPLLYAVTALGLGFTGPGRVSLDSLLGLSWSWPFGVYAAALGLLAGLTMVTLRRRELAKAPTREDGRSEERPATRIAA